MGAPRRILVTGASGFVGQHLIPALSAAFPDAVLFTNFFEITQLQAVEAALHSAAPDACIHLAGVTTIAGARADPERAWKVNLHGTLHLARAILARGNPCRLLFVSTSEVYGRSFRSGALLDEQAVLAPMNGYAATKAAADLALGAMVGDGLNLIRVRPFNHTGPGQTKSFVLPAFAHQIARIAAGRQPPVVHAGGLDSARDFLDVRDVCDAYVRCLTATETVLPSGSILNIASGTPRKIGAVLQQLLELAGVRAEVETEAALTRRSEILVACGNAALAASALDWRPRIAWEQTLVDIIADWRARVAATSEEPAATV
jgi:GDP-4-dehydro-6-deoxy-D-mannose reductase